LNNLFQSIIRASSFLRKEIFEILRQPRLVASLVLGPFLILFIFGIGYREQSPRLRTLFVTQPNSSINAEDIQQHVKTMASVITFVGTTDDQAKGLEQLHRRQIDLVIVVPGDAADTIQSNQQAVFNMYHQEIDPIQVNYITFQGWLFVGEVNKRVLRSFAEQGQKDSVDLQADLQDTRQNVSAMRQALQSGDEALAQEKQQNLSGNVDTVSQAVGASIGLLSIIQPSPVSTGGSAGEQQDTLTNLRQNTDQLGEESGTKDERLARLDKIDEYLTDLDNKLVAFQSVDPSIIVSPFRSEIMSVASVQPSISDFFAPAVLALLLQHLAITFAALSIVRERNAGTMELFRVSPLSAAEALFGKYISYLLFGGVIAAILSVLLVFTLRVPMLGNWRDFIIVIAAVLFTSLGIGFVISIVSQTDSQAVQYSMITLLASVFFSGFIMNLEMLWEPVRVISWMLPTTYGTLMLRDIALRGLAPNWGLLGGLFAIGMVLMIISWLLMRRLIVSSR
jgi:ABC-2 type transport system permease protein